MMYCLVTPKNDFVSARLISPSVIFSDITAEEFVMRPPNGKSPYDKFQALLADRLNIPLSHVAVFSVMNSEDGFTDVRYSAHGSPWYPASMLDGIVSLEKEKVYCKYCIRTN